MTDKIAAEKEIMEKLDALQGYLWNMDYSDNYLGFSRVHVYLNEYGLGYSVVAGMNTVGYRFLYIAKDVLASGKRHDKYYAVFIHKIEGKEAGF